MRELVIFTILVRIYLRLQRSCAESGQIMDGNQGPNKSIEDDGGLAAPNRLMLLGISVFSLPLRHVSCLGIYSRGQLRLCRSSRPWCILLSNVVHELASQIPFRVKGALPKIRPWRAVLR